MENVNIQKEMFFKNMSDLLLLRQAKRLNYKLAAIPRNHNWLNDLSSKKNIYSTSILNSFDKMNTAYRQTGYINSLLKVPENMSYALCIDFPENIHIDYYNDFISKLSLPPSWWMSPKH